MGRRAPPIKQASFRKDKSPRADRGDPAVPFGRIADEVDQTGCRGLGERAAADNQGVEWHVGERLTVYRHAGRRSDLSTFFGDEMKLVWRALGHFVGHFKGRDDGQRHDRIPRINDECDMTHDGRLVS